MKISNNIYEIETGNIIMGTNINYNRVDQLTKLIKYFVEMGGITIDTARSYSGGLSEFVIGKSIIRDNRKNIIVSTKVGNTNVEGKSSLNKEDIRKELELSLKVLKTDYIDILWLHRDDPKIMVEYIIDYMNDFIKEGIIKTFGASNWSFSRINKANIYAEEKGLNGFSASQIQWSVGYPNRDYYKKNGMVFLSDEYEEYVRSTFPIFAYSSQAKGIFYYMAKEKVFNVRQASFDNNENKEIYQIVREIAQRDKVEISTILLSFILYGKLNAVPIVGISSEQNIKDIMNTQKYIIKEEDYQRLLRERLKK